MLDRLTGHHVTQAMGHHRRLRGIQETKGPFELVAGLQGVEDRAVVVEAGARDPDTGVAVPGDTHEAGPATHHVEPLEDLGVPAARPLGVHVVAMQEGRPAVAQLGIR